MKKMMKMLALTLIAMMVLTVAAVAEEIEFVEAVSEDTYFEEVQAQIEEIETAEPEITSEPTFTEPTEAAPAEETTEAVVPEIAPEAAPLPESEEVADDEEVMEIADDQIPLSDGFAPLSVEITANNVAPKFGENVTLTSFVSNQGASALSYQWQINSGNGWENIENANGTEYTFNYNSAISGCSFRVFVDEVAA